MISKIMTNNNSVKFIAFLLALLIWLVAFWEEQPKSTTQTYTSNQNITFTNIPISVDNLPPEMRYTLSADVIEVTFLGEPTWLNRVSAADIKAYIDLKGLEEGQYTVDIYVEKLTNLYKSSHSPTQLIVTLDAVIDKEFTIEVAYIGELTPEFYLLTPPITEPEKAVVRGPRPEVEAIARVLSVVTLNYADIGFTQDVPLQLLDDRGVPLDLADLELTPLIVKVHQELETSAELALEEMEIALPETMRLSNLQITPSLLRVYITPELLQTMTSLSLPELDFVNATESYLQELGMSDSDQLWQALLGDSEIRPGQGTIIQQKVTFILDLPQGVRWADSVPNTLVEIEALLEIEWLGDSPQESPSIEDSVYASAYTGVYGNIVSSVYETTYR